MARRPFAAGSPNPSANSAGRVVTLDEYLRRLASSDPVPGGGSAAALIGAIAAALAAMVGRIASAPLDDVVAEADRLREELGAARLRDEAAFAAVVAAQALPKDDECPGPGAPQSHRRGAAARRGREPLRAAGLALRVLELDAPPERGEDRSRSRATSAAPPSSRTPRWPDARTTSASITNTCTTPKRSRGKPGSYVRTKDAAWNVFEQIRRRYSDW